ncbi:MAG: glycosyltransferase, partial [Chthoniobacterales bacterium]
GKGSFAFEVVRRPNPGQLVAAVRWSEVFWQNNISLRTIWPLLFIRRPLFVTQQTWIASPDGRSHWSHALKRVVLRCARSFAISRAVAETMPSPSAVIGNPYDEALFKIVPGTARNSDLIFVGRLVSDKGADLFLDALVHLRNSGLRPSATIVGDGPERAPLEKQTDREQLSVTFTGARSSQEIARLLNRHRILVVPSRWAEPFGIVALEGAACGCVVIGSGAGGLPEAIGPCGLTFARGDAAALADRIALLLGDDRKCDELRAASGPHLAQFTTVKVADVYLAKMAEARR